MPVDCTSSVLVEYCFLLHFRCFFLLAECHPALECLCCCCCLLLMCHVMLLL
uniref:Uncharacterized protein n=1 Tax=Triticum urartu TaxID=4572 RepID=A0A8R7PA97_TRIUA